MVQWYNVWSWFKLQTDMIKEIESEERRGQKQRKDCDNFFSS